MIQVQRRRLTSALMKLIAVGVAATTMLVVSTSPNPRWILQTGKPGAAFTKNGDLVRFSVDGVRGGQTIRVAFKPGGEGIITAFPL